MSESEETLLRPLNPATTKLDEARAVLVGVLPASQVSDQVTSERYLHAGPPLGTQGPPAPMRGALAAVLVFEGRCKTIEAAYELIDGGHLQLGSAHEAGGVGAVSGIISPSMPVVVVESSEGTRSFSPVNEGLGKVVRYGATDDVAIERLRWLADEFAPTLNRAIEHQEPGIDLTVLQAEGLRRGDECHNRNVASTAALVCRLAAAVSETASTPAVAARVLAAAAGNPHFFLPFSMASAKAVADASHGVAGSPIVTAMASNGHEFGVRVSGCGGTWFTAPAPTGEPKLFKGFGPEDVHPALGDSFITECIGLGACALNAAPAISSFLGTTPTQGRGVVDTIRTLTDGASSRFLVPHDEYEGTPIGIDVLKVASEGQGPYANNGLAHREAGKGQVGAALTQLPAAPFIEAAQLLSPKGAGRDYQGGT